MQHTSFPVSTTHGSGQQDGQQRWNSNRQRKSRIREENSHPACSDFTCSYLFEIYLSGKDFMMKHSRNLSVVASGCAQQ